MNELVAFYINSEAKFTKVFAEDVNKCFLMPAEFKDEAMRNFFRIKFKQFRENGSKLGKKVADVNMEHIQTERIPHEIDFSQEHLERKSLQHQYLRRNSLVELPELEQEGGGMNDIDAGQSDCISPLMGDNNLRDRGSISSSNLYIFSTEVQRAQKILSY